MLFKIVSLPYYLQSLAWISESLSIKKGLECSFKKVSIGATFLRQISEDS